MKEVKILSRAELKEIASINEKAVEHSYFVSLYLNIDPLFNKKGDYMVHFKNMMKNTIETLDKNVYKKIREDLEKIENYIHIFKIRLLPLLKWSLSLFLLF